MKPKEILLIWEKYFNDGNLKDIVNLYDEESILFPTFSNRTLLDKEEKKSYFKKVLIEQKVKVEIISNSVKDEKIGENIFLLYGQYIFKFNKEKQNHARFSFIVSILGDKPIKHHHSSSIP